ncbi:MAG: hypothetical protein ACREMA_02845 [Longimicrobiales bacterium]
MAVRHNPLRLLALIALGIAAPAAAQGNRTGPHSWLILLVDHAGPDLHVPVLDLVRKRLPLDVSLGSYATEDGVAPVCVYARRSVRRSLPAQSFARGLPACPMIVVIVDGVRISDAGRYLATTRVSDLESVELVSAGDAQLRYGLAGEGAEVLALWTRGRGPHSRKF